MKINTKQFDELKPALDFLEDATKNPYNIFRGHRNASWRLSNSLARYYDLHSAHELEVILNRFRSNLAKLGTQPEIDLSRQGDWLEYAQHYGVPTPLIDFTHSPYVALFFAFNGVNPKFTDDENVAIYILNVFHLGNAWVQFCNQCFNKNIDLRYWLQDDLNVQDKFGFGNLVYISQPGKNNSRMIRQNGAFIYDTVYHDIDTKDLEGFIYKHLESTDTILTKVTINKKCAYEVFQRLEFMGVTATSLYLDGSGAAMDTINAFVYQPRSMSVRDVDSRYSAYVAHRQDVLKRT